MQDIKGQNMLQLSGKRCRIQRRWSPPWILCGAARDGQVGYEDKPGGAEWITLARRLHYAEPYPQPRTLPRPRAVRVSMTLSPFDDDDDYDGVCICVINR